MIKTKTTNIHTPLVMMGYILFALLILQLVLSTIYPMGKALFDPRVLQHNVAAMIIGFSIGAIFPALVAYFIGDKSVKSKSKLSHHFNGILFALLGYWVLSVFALYVYIPLEAFSSFAIGIIAVNILPGIAVGIVTAILALAHIKSRQAKHDVIEYKPFGVALLAFIIVMPLWSLFANIVAQEVSVYSFMALATALVPGIISYLSLRKSKLKPFTKVVWSAVSVTVAFVAMYVAYPLASSILNYVVPMSSMELQATVGGAAWIVALAGWAVYWYIQVKALTKK